MWCRNRDSRHGVSSRGQVVNSSSRFEYALAISDLDEALALQATDGTAWLAFADPRYEAFNAMFGGWTAAILLRAIQLRSNTDATPSAITVNFFEKIAAGSSITVNARRLGGGRSIEHWQSTITDADDQTVLAQAMGVLSRRRPSTGHTEPKMPYAPDPSSLPLLHPPNNFGQRTDMRPVDGLLQFGRMETRSVHWTKEMSGRTIDHVQLAFLSDAYAPRSFYWSDGPGPSATITLSTYFHGTVDEITAIGDDYVLTEATGTRGVESTSGQQARLWSRGGALIATTEQLAWYR